MKTKLVKPAKGVRVFLLNTELPAEGAIVPWNSYWQRRAREGGIQIVAERKKAPAKYKLKANEDTDK